MERANSPDVSTIVHSSPPLSPSPSSTSTLALRSIDSTRLDPSTPPVRPALLFDLVTGEETSDVRAQRIALETDSLGRGLGQSRREEAWEGIRWIEFESVQSLGSDARINVGPSSFSIPAATLPTCSSTITLRLPPPRSPISSSATDNSMLDTGEEEREEVSTRNDRDSRLLSFGSGVSKAIGLVAPDADLSIVSGTPLLDLLAFVVVALPSLFDLNRELRTPQVQIHWVIATRKDRSALRRIVQRDRCQDLVLSTASLFLLFVILSSLSLSTLVTVPPSSIP